ncbi:PadR family transcriptional regulator [Bacillus sp. AR18-7]|nr:PadR family transcriptional regulator [Bacillus sp. AR18-7]
MSVSRYNSIIADIIRVTIDIFEKSPIYFKLWSIYLENR